MSLVLDTHAWVWWLQGDAGLTARERSTLDDLSRDLRPCIADISLWEIAALYEKGRFVISALDRKSGAPGNGSSTADHSGHRD